MNRTRCSAIGAALGLAAALLVLTPGAAVAAGHSCPLPTFGPTVYDGQLSVSVADIGPGLPRELGERAFEPFVRGPGAAGPGSGLGLAIVQAVAEAHGGWVEAVNAPGGGAAVSLVVPT